MKQIYMSEARAAIVGAGGDYEPDRAVSDVDDPDLGAAALEDDATCGVYGVGGSEEGGGMETWPDDFEEEDAPRHMRGADKVVVGSSAAPSAQAGTRKRKQGAA